MNTEGVYETNVQIWAGRCEHGDDANPPAGASPMTVMLAGDLPFGRRLRKTRMRRRWSHLNLATRMARVGTQHDGSATVESLATMISKWENGHMMPSQYNLHLLAAALDIEVEDLGI